MHKAGLSKAETRILEQNWEPALSAKSLTICWRTSALLIRPFGRWFTGWNKKAHCVLLAVVFSTVMLGAFLEPCRIPLVVSLMSMSPRSPYFHILSRADAKSPTMAS